MKGLIKTAFNLIGRELTRKTGTPPAEPGSERSPVANVKMFFMRRPMSNHLLGDKATGKLSCVELQA